ncbi:MAG: hypothetical protein QME25_01300 [Bacteroidota bacterium]|nr:hypothetical protein [Bacteroidota bacterium]
MRILEYFLILYALYWGFCFIGIFIVRSRYGTLLESFTWNSRIDAFQKIPFIYLLKYITEKEFLIAAILVALINLNNVIIQFLLGFVLVSPIMSVFSGFIVGCLLGQAEKRTLWPYSILTLIFEFGAFSIGGAIGMAIGYEWLLGNLPFFEAFLGYIESLPIFIWFLTVLFLIINGLIEAGGPVFFDVKGIPDIDSIKNKYYKGHKKDSCYSNSA